MFDIDTPPVDVSWQINCTVVPFSLDKIHRFTLSSARKQASLGVILLGIAISFGYREKKQLQMLAEW